MNKICLIRQSAGLGDIFFCQKIGCYYKDRGYEIVWPVIKEFTWLSDYLDNFDYCSVDSDFIHKDSYTDLNNKAITDNDAFIFIPLHGHYLLDSSVMISKYRFVNIDHRDWANYFNFKRNINKENILFYDILRLNDDSEYNFVNKIYASP